MNTFTLTLIDILILAIVQGITEWLPVSSSGHLVIVSESLGILLDEKTRVVFYVTLHVGTLFVVLVVFWKDITKIVNALIRLDFKVEEGKLALYIAVGSIPTALIGFLFQSTFESLFSNPLAVGVALLFTGFFLYVSERRKDNQELGYLDSLLIGIAQGIAIIPGFSRSGFTITAGLLRKVKREVAFRYSFLLFIPAIIGATIAEFSHLETKNIDMAAMLLGAAISMIVGYISLKLLQKIVMKKKFHLFAYYCWTVGAIIIFSQIYH